MKTKSIVVLFALLVTAVLVLVACQPQIVEKTVEVEKVVEKTVVVEQKVEVEKVVEKTVVVEAAGGGEAKYKEALKGKKLCAVFPGPINDAGWTTAAYKGLTHMRDVYGMEIAYREEVKPEETEDVLRQFVEAGCDVMHAHGFEYADQINKVASEYPDKQFTQTSRGQGKEPNVIGLSFKSGEEGYFAGMIGCLVSESKKIAWVVGQTYPNLQWNQEQAKVAFDQLVADGKIKEPCTVDWLEVGSWTDPVKAKELTKAGIEKGIDTYVMVADAGDPGIIEAIEEARAAGKKAWAVSGVGDKNYLGPEFVVGGYEEAVWKQIELAIKAWVDKGGATYADMPTGVREETITWAPFYGILPEADEKYVVDAIQCYMEKGTDCPQASKINVRTDL